MDYLVKKTVPTPRAGVYPLYWGFAARRQAVFEARVRGEPAPWTADPILQQYKFCNVFRASDRVSQYLIRQVAYASYHGAAVGEAEDLLLQILLMRTFSRISTWDFLLSFYGGPPRVKHLYDGSLAEALGQAKAANDGLYTGAFILCANDAYGKKVKHLNHIALFAQMFGEARNVSRLLAAKSLETLVRELESYPLLGPFMSYQMAVDLNYSELFDFSENDFTQAGPGALRGLKKAFVDLGDYTPAEAVLWMVDNQEQEFARLGLRFDGLFGVRGLHAIDCQGLFCELDKYCRVAVPELLSARKKIKTKFEQTGVGLRLFYPPKWGVNERVPGWAVLG